MMVDRTAFIIIKTQLKQWLCHLDGGYDFTLFVYSDKDPPGELSIVLQASASLSWYTVKGTALPREVVFLCNFNSIP